MYGKGQLTNSLITKARSIVATYYAIPGHLSEDEIADRVRWLLSKGIFRYGGVNIAVRVFGIHFRILLILFCVRTRPIMFKRHSLLLWLSISLEHNGLKVVDLIGQRFTTWLRRESYQQRPSCCVLPVYVGKLTSFCFN
jgi:hypothetical protein